MEYLIPERLEGGGSIRQAERHDKELVVPMMSAEGCLLNVFLRYPNLVIPRTQVQLGEVFGPIKFVQEFIYYGYWKFILYRDLVSLPVIYTHPPCSIPFLD